MIDYLGGLKPEAVEQVLRAIPAAARLMSGAPVAAGPRTGAPIISATTPPSAPPLPAPLPPVVPMSGPAPGSAPTPAGPVPAGVSSPFGGPAFLPPAAPTPADMSYLAETQADGSILLRVKLPDGTPGPVLQVIPTPKQITKAL